MKNIDDFISFVILCWFIMESFKWEEEIIIFLLTLETEFLKEHKIKRLNCETFLGIDHWEKSGDSLSQCQNCLENIPK